MGEMAFSNFVLRDKFWIKFPLGGAYIALKISLSLQ
jgi:hypothetical protein